MFTFFLVEETSPQMENDDGRKMDFFDNENYKIFKVFMSLVGTWPYQEYKTRLPRIIVSYGALILSTSVVGAKFFTIEYDINEIIDVIAFLIPIMCYFVGYITVHTQLTQMKFVLEWIKFDYGILQSPEEIDILKKYSAKSKQITIILTVIFYIFVLLVIFTHALPTILDNINVPLNGTRERKCPFPFETFINFEETTLGVIVTVMTMTVVGFVALSVYGAIVLLLYHVCGMFNVTGYILEHAFLENDRCVITRREREMIGKRIDRSIRFHIRTIKCFETIRRVYEVCYSIQIGLALILIAADYTKVMLFDKETLLENKNDAIVAFCHTGGILFSLFINCHAGQEIINHSTDVFYKASVVPWYLASKKTQTSAIMILIRSQVPCCVGIGEVFVSSYEFFTAILKASMSCATVFYTVQ